MKKVILLMFICFTLISNAYDFDIEIQGFVQNTIYNEFSPAQFNPADPESQPIIFTVIIKENVPDGYPSPVPFSLLIDIKWRGDDLDKAKLTHSEPYDGNPPISLSNRDLISENPPEYLGFGVDDDINFNDFLQSNPDFEDEISKGTLPDGDYVITLNMLGENDELIADPEIIAFTVMKPTLIQLSSPGFPFGFGIGTTPNPYPDFVWTSNLQEFTLRLFEMTPYEFVNQIDSPEDIENQFEPFEIEGITSTIYPYKGQLRENRIYAWQVSAVLSSVAESTLEDYKSAMYVFTISEDTEVDLEVMMLRNTLEFLQQLEIEGVDEILKLLESGYTFDDVKQGTGNISIRELCDLLSSDDQNIKKITVR